MRPCSVGPGRPVIAVTSVACHVILLANDFRRDNGRVERCSVGTNTAVCTAARHHTFRHLPAHPPRAQLMSLHASLASSARSSTAEGYRARRHGVWLGCPLAIFLSAHACEVGQSSRRTSHCSSKQVLRRSQTASCAVPLEGVLRVEGLGAIVIESQQSLLRSFRRAFCLLTEARQTSSAHSVNVNSGMVQIMHLLSVAGCGLGSIRYLSSDK